MKFISNFTLGVKSLAYYWRGNLAVAAGTLICTMVLTGTLMVGDSVESSLEQTTHLRLGNTSFLLSGTDRYFSSGLAAALAEDVEDLIAAPVLQVNGIVSVDGGNRRLNSVQVNGIDKNFMDLMPERLEEGIPKENAAYISTNLASFLDLDVGDNFLLRIEKVSQIPKNAPFVSSEDEQVSLRLKVSKILPNEHLGRFNLKTSQTAPFNVFLSLDFLNEKLELKNKANRLLFAGLSSLDQSQLKIAINRSWSMDDMALQIDKVENTGQLEVSSSRVFIEPVAEKAIDQIKEDHNKYLTYFVNSLTVNSGTTPYSFISAGDFHFNDQPLNEGEILINRWLADDLDAGPGDSLSMTYYVIGPLRNLVEEKADFVIKGIVPMEGIFADKELMPHIPGMTDAGNCSDWNTSVPIDLDKIRNKDEDYWTQWKGTPKAFVAYEQGKELWENRFGSCTAIRFDSSEISAAQLTQRIPEETGPESFGVVLKPVKEEGLKAARSGVDFSQLFMGLSFFLLVGGITLLALLYNLHLERRMSETGTLKALGFTNRRIRNIFFMEGMLIAIPGVVIGGTVAIIYNKLVFIGLNTVWSEIVRTTILQEVIRWPTVVSGMVLGLLLVWITMFINTTRKLKSQAALLQRRKETGKRRKLLLWIHVIAWISGIAALFLLISDLVSGGSLNPALFFTAGGLLLISLISVAALFVFKAENSLTKNLSMSSLARDNLFRKPSRSLRIITLFALGTFIIVSTGLNQKDLYSGSEKKDSGTGGFLFYGEFTMPVLVDLNHHTQNARYVFDHDLSFLQLRTNGGDDASCLNLNRITQPQILGIKSEKLKDRFSFVKLTDDVIEEDPWLFLEKTLEGGVIPAIADQTVIQWSLGKKVGDTLIYWDERGEMMRLKLVGGLANSIFQGNVLIHESHFLDHYPSSSGTNIILVDGEFSKSEAIRMELQREFRSEGLEVELAANRLARFNEVENTYLTIFLLLGGLGMILGTVGLGISLARNLIDRRQELGLLRAVGYSNQSIKNIITLEHLALLFTGTIIGAVSAFTATLPSILSKFVDASWQTAAIIIALIVLNGFLWIYIVSNQALKKPLIASLRSE